MAIAQCSGPPWHFYIWRRLHNRWDTVMKNGIQPESIGGIDIRFTGPEPRPRARDVLPPQGHDQIVAKQGGWAP
ncbi:hypothetical protein [Streptomyces sp. MBT55]|uniref:hypothetical protein n=1 Tax=Streptomyces sp. MBT55 TaxID=1488386 RepID=UPI0019127DE5|nr:hypothetical protein [Streptomyces sp. MBT55]MBK6041239.1 hypothetical protein [Streptomyces sp. MBT55]